LRGSLGAERQHLMQDAALAELLRVRHWLRSGCTSITAKDDGFAGVPEGWPPGADPDAAVAEVVDALFKPVLATVEPTTPRHGNVARLRELINRGDKS